MSEQISEHIADSIVLSTGEYQLVKGVLFWPRRMWSEEVKGGSNLLGRIGVILQKSVRVRDLTFDFAVHAPGIDDDDGTAWASMSVIYPTDGGDLWTDERTIAFNKEAECFTYVFDGCHYTIVIKCEESRNLLDMGEVRRVEAMGWKELIHHLDRIGSYRGRALSHSEVMANPEEALVAMGRLLSAFHDISGHIIPLLELASEIAPSLNSFIHDAREALTFTEEYRTANMTEDRAKAAKIYEGLQQQSRGDVVPGQQDWIARAYETRKTALALYTLHSSPWFTPPMADQVFNAFRDLKRDLFSRMRENAEQYERERLNPPYAVMLRSGVIGGVDWSTEYLEGFQHILGDDFPDSLRMVRDAETGEEYVVNSFGERVNIPVPGIDRPSPILAVDPPGGSGDQED